MSIVGRDWLSDLKFTIEPKTKDKLSNSINTVSKEVVTPNQKWRTEMSVQFPNHFERRGRRKHHKIHARLHEGAVVKQQTGRRVPIHLPESLKKEVKRSLQEGHIVKVGEIKEDVFLQPTVKTVEHFFSTLDLTYVYAQVERSENASKHCNFQSILEKATGVYRFVAGFYRLTTMPTKFQSNMDLTLVGISNTFSFIDNFLIVMHGTRKSTLKRSRKYYKDWTKQAII